jgi:hypothetical protein
LRSLLHAIIETLIPGSTQTGRGEA